MLHRHCCQRREGRRLVQHPLGQIRVHPHPLPLARTERPRLVPNRIRDAETAQIMDERRPSKHDDIVCRQPESDGSFGGEICDSTRMPERVWRLQIDEVGNREQRAIEVVAGDRHSK